MNIEQEVIANKQLRKDIDEQIQKNKGFAFK